MSNADNLQIAKLISDLFELITTLNIGLLGAIVTIVDKVFTTNKVFNSRINTILLMLIFLLFTGSLAFSLTALSSIPNNTRAMLEGKSTYWVSPYSFYISIYSFLGGVGAFIFLFLKIFLGSTVAQKVPPKQQDIITPLESI